MTCDSNTHLVARMDHSALETAALGRNLKIANFYSCLWCHVAGQRLFLRCQMRTPDCVVPTLETV